LSLTTLALKANALSAGNSSSRALANKDVNKTNGLYVQIKETLKRLKSYI
jgi:hypothetical protein